MHIVESKNQDSESLFDLQRSNQTATPSESATAIAAPAKTNANSTGMGMEPNGLQQGTVLGPTSILASRSLQPSMPTPQALLERIETYPEMGQGHKRLVVIFSQLGDFDSLEYADALVKSWEKISASSIQVHAIGIGNNISADRFCAFTGYPRDHLSTEPNAELHHDLGLYQGLNSGGGPWPNLLLMCAGLGSPGTLKEVIRGYTGDRSAPSRLTNSLFDLAGKNFQRPFELATVRLQNMVEVLGRWGTYLPDQSHLCQRGGTYLLDENNELLYYHYDKGILGFSETMAQPLSFLDAYLSS